MKDNLFGKYCYIDTPWIAGKKTIYRILASDIESNTYYEVPYSPNSKPVSHGYNFEKIVFVVLDTLAGENSEILRFALKDVEIIDDESKEVKHGHWKTYTKLAHTAPPFTYKIIECSLCRNPVQKYWNFCPWCGADMKGGVDNG